MKSLLLTLCSSLLFSPGVILGAGASLKVGLARIDITPNEPVELGGYASRTMLSQGIHDRLYARVNLFDDGSNQLLLVSTDGIGFYTGGYEYLIKGISAETGLQKEQVFLSSIHSHSSPRIGTDEELHSNNIKYTKWLLGRLVDAIKEARASLEPATIGIGRGASPVGVNRRETIATGEVRLGRNPGGIHDREVLVVKIKTTGSRKPALLFSYATHATSLGAASMLISGDLLGIAEQYVENVLGSEAVASAFIGASGDIDPWYRVLPGFDNRPGWIPETELLGQLLGTEVVRVFREIDTFHSDVPVKARWKTMSLPGKTKGERFPGSEEVTEVKLNLMVGRIGNLGIVGFGGEVLTEVGLRIKDASPFDNTLIITHCNGAAGYLAPRHLYKEGGYEILTSPFAPDAADQVVREVLQMLHRMH